MIKAIRAHARACSYFFFRGENRKEDSARLEKDRIINFRKFQRDPLKFNFEIIN